MKPIYRNPDDFRQKSSHCRPRITKIAKQTVADLLFSVLDENLDCNDLARADIMMPLMFSDGQCASPIWL